MATRLNNYYFWTCVNTYFNSLRVQTFFRKTFRVYHVYCKFILGYMCWIFGRFKNDILLINTYASNNYFSNRNIFQNGVTALSKIDDAFLQKAENFILFGLSDNVQISLAWGINMYCSLLRNYKWHFRLPMSSIATVTRKKPLQHQLFTQIFHSS